MATNCSVAVQCRAQDSQAWISGKAVRNIVIGVVAAITVTYGETRVIEQAPSFVAACLVALSSDFKRVLDTNIGEPASRVQVMY
ncbi:MAG TPA: hypothetical protein VKG21_05570 [Casimicrobiaceae bacterium]|nr:hypothetical protein [Casimicrobiaceae bacterium]